MMICWLIHLYLSFFWREWSFFSVVVSRFDNPKMLLFFYPTSIMIPIVATGVLEFIFPTPICGWFTHHFSRSNPDEKIPSFSKLDVKIGWWTPFIFAKSAKFKSHSACWSNSPFFGALKIINVPLGTVSSQSYQVSQAECVEEPCEERPSRHWTMGGFDGPLQWIAK